MLKLVVSSSSYALTSGDSPPLNYSNTQGDSFQSDNAKNDSVPGDKE